MPLSILGEQRTGAESRLAMDDSSAQSCTEGGLNPGVLGEELTPGRYPIQSLKI